MKFDFEAGKINVFFNVTMLYSQLIESRLELSEKPVYAPGAAINRQVNTCKGKRAKSTAPNTCLSSSVCAGCVNRPPALN